MVVVLDPRRKSQPREQESLVSPPLPILFFQHYGRQEILVLVRSLLWVMKALGLREAHSLSQDKRLMRFLRRLTTTTIYETSLTQRLYQVEDGELPQTTWP